MIEILSINGQWHMARKTDSGYSRVPWLSDIPTRCSGNYLCGLGWKVTYLDAISKGWDLILQP